MNIFETIVIILIAFDIVTSIIGVNIGYKESNTIPFIQLCFINVLLIILILKIDAVINNLEVLL